MARRCQAILAVLAIFCVVSASAQFNWAFDDFVQDTLATVTGGGSPTPAQQEAKTEKKSRADVDTDSASPEEAIVCTQEVVCGSDGETYPNPCLAAEAGVEVVACTGQSPSGPLFGIPDALIGIGQNIFGAVTSPLTGVAEKVGMGGESGDGGFNPVDPLGLFNDPFDNIFQGLGRRLLRTRAR